MCLCVPRRAEPVPPALLGGEGCARWAAGTQHLPAAAPSPQPVVMARLGKLHPGSAEQSCQGPSLV